MPDLQIVNDTPINIEYTTTHNEYIERGFVAICFLSISFQNHQKLIINREFSKHDKKLVVEIPGAKHEMLHRFLDEAIFMDSLAIGLLNEFVSVGGAKYFDSMIRGNAVASRRRFRAKT